MIAALLGIVLAGASIQTPAGTEAERLERTLASLRDGTPGSYQAAIAAGEPIVPGVLAMLADRELASVTRFMSANVLGEIGSTAAVEGLIAALGDRDYNVRRCSALALGAIGDARAKPVLAKLAAEDPFAWTDPKTGVKHFLVREDASKALEMLSRTDVELADASQPPPLKLACKLRRVTWPFPGGYADQNLFNNYQQVPGPYVHAGLDLLQPKGTPVRAVEDGWIRLVDTNYPEWKTHHFLVVATTENGNEGFAYTHVDPDTYAFKVGERVRQGEVLGKLVDFAVGANDGVDHLHLEYVELVANAQGRLEPVDLADPLQFFDAPDEVAPVIEPEIHLVRRGTLDPFARDADGFARVSGRVDAICGLSDVGRIGQSCIWGVPVVTLEVRSGDRSLWRKLVCDWRGPVGEERATGALFVDSAAASRFGGGPTVRWMIVTHTDGDGRLQQTDKRSSWDTLALDAGGKRRFPDGDYELVVRAWDLSGNRAERAVKVRVANGD
jgi:murein DD-endopeptidase MepM/ murein hydrolase activator NlpD